MSFASESLNLSRLRSQSKSYFPNTTDAHRKVLALLRSLWSMFIDECAFS